MNHSTGTVVHIALLITLASFLVSRSYANVYALTKADAFSSQTTINLTTPQKIAIGGESQYVHIFINGVAYEGTLHLSK